MLEGLQAHKKLLGTLAQLPRTSAQWRQVTEWPGKCHLLIFSTDGKKLLLKKAEEPLKSEFSVPQDEINLKQKVQC